MMELNHRSSRYGRSSTELLEQLTFSPAFLFFHLHSLITSSDSKDNAGSLGASSN